MRAKPRPAVWTVSLRLGDFHCDLPRANGNRYRLAGALVISLAPIGFMALAVHLLVNGRPPSYARDLTLLAIWRRLWGWLSMTGTLDRPPELWVRMRKSIYPTLFDVGTGGVLSRGYAVHFPDHQRPMTGLRRHRERYPTDIERSRSR